MSHCLGAALRRLGVASERPDVGWHHPGAAWCRRPDEHGSWTQQLSPSELVALHCLPYRLVVPGGCAESCCLRYWTLW